MKQQQQQQQQQQHHAICWARDQNITRRLHGKNGRECLLSLTQNGRDFFRIWKICFDCHFYFTFDFCPNLVMWVLVFLSFLWEQFFSDNIFRRLWENDACPWRLMIGNDWNILEFSNNFERPEETSEWRHLKLQNFGLQGWVVSVMVLEN